MKKILILMSLSTMFLACNPIRYRYGNQSQLDEYVARIDKIIAQESKRPIKKNGHKKRTLEELSMVPTSFKGTVVVSTQDYYTNVYDGYDDHLIISMRTDGSDNPHGVYKKFDKDENLIELGYFEENEVRSGTIREFYPTGQLKATYPLYFETLTGPATYYTKDGAELPNYEYIGKDKVFFDYGNPDGVGVMQSWK